MKKYPIRFKNIDEVTEFVKAVNQFDCDVDLRRGSVIIDAKSFLGVLTISGDADLELVIHDGDQAAVLESVAAFVGVRKTA